MTDLEKHVSRPGRDKIVKKGRSCPRCGPGIFLSTGKGRSYCGRCHFTEFEKKNAEPMLEAKK